MTREEAKKEIEKVFEPAFANYIVEALTKGATVSEKEPTTKNDLGVDKTFYEQIVEYCNEHFLVLVEKDVWEDARKALTTKNDSEVDKTDMIDKSNFSQEQYKADLQSAYDCGVASVNQEPKKGHWILTYGNVKCSVCGSVKDSRDVGKATHYCDFCGAKMESEE